MRLTLALCTAAALLAAACLRERGHAEPQPAAADRERPQLHEHTDRAALADLDALTLAAQQGDPDAQVALGQRYLQGRAAVPRDVARARAWFVRAERSRHPAAAYFLGLMHQSGQGAALDPAAAARWFELAARRGSPDAMFLLANALRAGVGVPRDDARAVALYERAGEREHAGALQALAMAYQYGELGLAPDAAEHRRYMMAAEHAISHAASDHH